MGIDRVGIVRGLELNVSQFLYIHLAPKEMKNKIKEKLFLDINTFKNHCKNVCDINEQKKKEEANNFHYWGTPTKYYIIIARNSSIIISTTRITVIKTKIMSLVTSNQILT